MSTSEEETIQIVESAESLLSERDEQDDGDGSPEPSGVTPGSDSSGDGYASREFPPLLRAQRLSYALAMILHNISAAEGRQVGSNSSWEREQPLFLFPCTVYSGIIPGQEYCQILM